MFPQAHRLGQRQRMAGARLLLARRDHPQVVRQFRRDLLEQRQAARVDAVVIGDQDPHCRAYGGKAATVPILDCLLRPLSNIAKQCESPVGQCLLSWGGLTIGRVGIAGGPGQVSGKPNVIASGRDRWPGPGYGGDAYRGGMYGDRIEGPLRVRYRKIRPAPASG